jgi:hypothetical protein
MPYLLAGLLVVGLGAAAYWISSRRVVRPPPVVEVPIAKPVLAAPKKETRVAFESHPAGAEVFEGETRLGETPFEASMPLEAAPTPRQFIFRKAGHVDEVVEQALDGDRVKIVARLKEEPPPLEVAEPEPEVVRKPVRKPKKPTRDRTKVPIPDDFKENPY